MLPACVPPFDSLFILLCTGAVTILIALRAGGPANAAAEPGARKPISPRTLLRAAAYVLLVTALIWGVLAAGLAYGLWGV